MSVLKDIRMVYLAVTVLIIVGVAYPFRVDVPATEYTLAVYKAVEAIKPGDYALIIWRGIPYTDEWTAQDIVARHIIRKGGYSIWYVETSEYLPYMIREMDEIYGSKWQNHPEYGKTFAAFGYIPVSEITLTNIAKDASLVFKSDMFGTPVSKLPVMANLSSGKDVRLILGFPGAWRIIGVIYGPYGTSYLHVETIGGLVGRIDSYRAGLLTGIVGGARGAAEYETLTGIISPDNWKWLTPMLYISVLATAGLIVPNVYAALRRVKTKEKVVT